MVTVIGVRFRKAGKIYYFDGVGKLIKRGDHVIVETARGIEYGAVVIGPRLVEESELVLPLKKVIRVSTEEDDEKNSDNQKKERKAYKICLEKIAKHGLDMKLIDVEYTFDNNKVLFYFSAEGRIDFRELVKDLASIFKTRIELRQIGVRDETKMCGGIGVCGMSLCCSSYLTEFQPVSIKMAKEQNLSLNPNKISGVCGRLMCCLKYEENTYEELNKNLPSVGDMISTPDGIGEVQHVNVIRQMIKVIIRKKDKDETELRDYKVDDIKILKRKKNCKGCCQQGNIDYIDEEEKRELEKLENERIEDGLEGGK